MDTVLITGASRGIGRETAILFARSGYNVLANYNNSKAQAEELLSILRSEGLSIEIFKADVSNRGEVDAMVDFCASRFGRIDVLVNNAGVSEIKVFGDISERDWDRVVDVNLKGVFNCCQAVLPYMLRQKRGRIINVSSIWGLTGASCEVHYSAAKAGVIGLTRALAKELGPSNINVNCVAPGIIETEMNSGLGEDVCMALREETPLMRFGTAQDVARTILFLASDSASFYTGQVLSPNGGFVI